MSDRIFSRLSLGIRMTSRPIGHAYVDDGGGRIPKFGETENLTYLLTTNPFEGLG